MAFGFPFMRIAKIYDGFGCLVTMVSNVAAYIGAFLVLATALMIAIDVILRYIFNNPTPFATDLTGYSLVAVTFLGLAYTLRHGKHVRIQIVTSRLRSKTRKIVDLAASVVALAFLVFCIFPVYNQALESYTYKSQLLDYFRTPLYIPQLIICVGVCLMTLELVVHIVNQIRSPLESESLDPREFNKDSKA